MYNVIGLGCIARVGKDSACAILQKYVPNLVRVAFADELKTMVDPFLTQNFGISAFTAQPAEKEIIRPVLVGVGMTARAKHFRFWIERVKSKVQDLLDSGKKVCITDVRFQQRDGDECDFVQKELGGVMVNMDRIDGFTGKLYEPANHEERTNYPIIKERANTRIMASSLVELEEVLKTNIIPLLQPYEK